MVRNVIFLPVDVVVELVIAGKCKQNSKARSKREENLCSCIDPYLITNEQ